ncbi:unnamed protein product [Mytilus coruscus]|uniref:Uncharacterized protein n=1 Tax=Mytilus coruscus TaxID=42192 RepID=A0A6J8D2J4_MYTCO|nr:unnamed protein product [Mytilus coruscus]
MLVKLNFPQKSKNKIQTRKRTSRAVAKANYKLNKTQQRVKELKRRNWTITKRLQRRSATENKDYKKNLVDVEEKGVMTKRMNVVQCEANRQEFGTLIRTSLNEFRAHVYRVQTQYEQIRTLKENLPKYNVICQMDFAENYSCVHADEVQSAYFDKASVTLHPVVLYYKVDGDINLHRKSFVFISDEPGHNSSTVYAFIKDLIPMILQTAPGTKTVHYITDSPTSQYRNKYIFFHLMTLHGMLFDGITASWHYFEAGHGKAFMTKSNPVSHTMKWSTRQEELWVTETEIVYQVQNPTPVGRTPVRMYKISSDDVNKIESLL